MNSFSNPDPAETQHSWDQGWDGHKQQQLLRVARLSFAEKVAWLEEAHRVVRQLEASRKPTRPFEK